MPGAKAAALLLAALFCASAAQAGSAASLLVKRDRSFAAYTLVYEADESLMAAYPGAGSQPKRITRKRKITVLWSETKGWRVTDEDRTKPGRFLSYGSSSEAPHIGPGTVTFNKADRTDPALTQGLAVGLHPILALGASKLAGLKEIDRGSSSVVSGTGTAGWRYEFHLTGGRPDRLLRTLRSDEEEYSYSDWTSGQRSFPRHAAFKQKGFVQMEAAYRILSLTIGEPEMPQDDGSWLRPGIIITDSRLSKPYVYTYQELLALNGGSTAMTASQLLEISKRREAGLIVTPSDRMLAASARAARPKGPSPILIVGVLAAAGAVLAAVGFVLSTIRERRKPAGS